MNETFTPAELITTIDHISLFIQRLAEADKDVACCQKFKPVLQFGVFFSFIRLDRVFYRLNEYNTIGKQCRRFV